MPSSKDLLAQFSRAAGVPGNEGDVRRLIRQHLAGIADISYDKSGSIICRRIGGLDAPRILLAAHTDEVGFLVRFVTPDGFVKFHPMGSWWEHTLLAQRVVIKTATGDVPGIIGAKSVHHLTPEERNRVQDIRNMFIDVGAKDKAEATDVFGIMPGDAIVPQTEFMEMKNPRLVSGKAFDDRAGVAVFVDALTQLAGETLPNALYAVGTVQEEVGSRGAETAVDLVNPDVAIVLEASPADDTPGFAKDEQQGVLGKGAQIRLFDPTTIPNRTLVEFVLKTARDSNIAHQTAVRINGGTDARQIHLHAQGVPTIVIAPPVRYIHSHVSLLHLDDYDQTLRLLIELLRRLDAPTVSALTAFDKE